METETLTSSNTKTFANPLSELIVEYWGGGGGTGAPGNTDALRIRGGGGAYSKKTFTDVPAGDYRYVIGAGGEATGTAGGSGK